MEALFGMFTSPALAVKLAGGGICSDAAKALNQTGL